ncbi:uncharacterized protein E0L32_009376 [Thyridium curvatum]|uniref:Uncharacterized protein n=1 Tax=Thyridium curvatum TaxID=1093900 RepID=A0A507AXD6_9PEZI|nr:uncharacterized protein E0L32_009376 [Thyridium curvatum]TPX09488.1 hypothetical protein E0L32_009376 [Thyridium curvatum]
MLDENLPTFHYRASTENPLSSILFYTQHGSDPTPEYVLKRADPATTPAARNRYAAALTDPYSPDIVFGEVVVDPEWQQPTLSAAEIRAQGGQQQGPPPPLPAVPDSFSIQLYNPDQTVPVRLLPGSWNKTEAWEFEMPTQTFRVPSASRVDRESPRAPGAPSAVSEFAPKITFRWKRDGRLSKDMTCYNVGRSLGKHRSKEPDITVALFKSGRESAVTIYEPNLQRVEVEDRKGLDIVLLLGAEVIRDLYLAPRQDPFNVHAAAAAAADAVANGKRKNSRPGGASSAPPLVMSGAAAGPPPTTTLANGQPPASSSSAAAAAAAYQQQQQSNGRPGALDAETKRLQAMVAQEQKEREKRDREEQKRIKKMLEAEDKERRRREAEVDRETERLKKMYGVQGQDLPSNGGGGGGRPPPHLPPRQAGGGGPPQQVSFAPLPYHSPPPAGHTSWFGPAGGPPPMPPRPVSAGPPAVYGSNTWYQGPGGAGPPYGPPQQAPPPGKQGKRRSGSNPYGSGAGAGAGASISGFFHRDRGGGGGGADRDDGEKKRILKKKSTNF